MRPVSVSGSVDTPTGNYNRLTGNADDCGASNPLAGERDVQTPGCGSTRRAPAPTTATSSFTPVRPTSRSRSPVPASRRCSRAARASLSFNSMDVDEGPGETREGRPSRTRAPRPCRSSQAHGRGRGNTSLRSPAPRSDCSTTTVLRRRDRPCEAAHALRSDRDGRKTGTVTVDCERRRHRVELTGPGTQSELVARPSPLAFAARDIDDGAAATQTRRSRTPAPSPSPSPAITLTGS